MSTRDHGQCSNCGERHECDSNLAAQAPAMARLLLSLEWEGGNTGDDGYTWFCCPSCEAWKKDDKHTPDCALVAVLRAAGVIE